MDRFLRTERAIATLHIPASLCLAVGTLAEANVLPYMAKNMWQLILVSSLFLFVANARDANGCVRDFFITDSVKAIIGNKHLVRKVHHDVEGQMHMFAAVTMTLGSLSLFNASVIALVHTASADMENCRRQYALAFGLHLIGAAGNNIATDKAMQEVNATRVLLSFQNVITSAAYGISAILLLPSMQFAQDNVVHQLALTVSTTVGGTMAVLSAVMQYFHTLAYSHTQLDYFIRTQSMMMQHNSGMSASIPTDDRGYVRRLTDVIRTRGKSLLWSEAVQVEAEEINESADDNINSEEELIVLSGEAETPVEWTHSSSTSSVQGTLSAEEDGSVRRQSRTCRR